MQSLDKELVERGDFEDRYQESRKKQFLDSNDDFDEFLKSQGLRLLENGQVVKDE